MLFSHIVTLRQQLNLLAARCVYTCAHSTSFSKGKLCKTSTNDCNLLPSAIEIRYVCRTNINAIRIFSSKPHVSHIYPAAASAAGFNDYEKERQEFNLKAPEYYNFATDVIDRWAEQEKSADQRKGMPAFWWVSDEGLEVKWSFQELADNSRRVAHMLRAMCRLQPGDRILVILPRLPQWWLINIACVRAGVVLIPGTTQLTANDIKHRIQRSGVRCVIADAPTAEKVDQVISECPTVMMRVLVEGLRFGWYMFEDLYLYCRNEFDSVKSKSSDVMTIFFTSGTTGPPKMTEHTHASYGLGHRITARSLLDLVPIDVHWNLSDTGWAKSAWSNLFSPWLSGACVFIHFSRSPKFDPEKTMQMLEKYPVTTFCAPPTAYRMMIKHDLRKYSFKSLRHCISGGEPVNPEVIDSWFDGTKQLIRDLYGQTETVCLCAASRCLPLKPGSMGKPPPGVDLTIVGDDLKEVPVGTEGEIALRIKPVRPFWLFARYVDDVDKTTSSFKGDFYLTGDRAYKDEDGYFWFVSRSDDIIISAGYRIGPFEVESALLEHTAVLESAVVASPDPTRGEVVKAFVVLTTDYQNCDKEALVTELQSHVMSVTAPYKYPRKIEFVESLPKTVSGKIRRTELRAKEWTKTVGT